MYALFTNLMVKMKFQADYADCWRKKKRNKLPMSSKILSHTKCSSVSVIIIKLVNKTVLFPLIYYYLRTQKVTNF